MLHHTCILGVAQHQGRGTKSEVVASPLSSPGPTNARNCCVTHAISNVPKQGNKIKSACLTTAFSGARKRAVLLRNPCILGGPQRQRRVKNQKWLPYPCLLGGPQMGGNATSPLHSRGSPTPTRGTKSEVVASPPPSTGPTNARNCCVTHAISNVPKQGNKIKSGYLTTAFSGAPKRAVLLRNHCILGGPQRQARGTKSEVPASPLPSRGPTNGRKCYITLAFSGVPNTKGGEKWFSHPCLLRGPQMGGNATSPLHSWGHPTASTGTKSEVATSPLPSHTPTNGRKCYVTRAFSRVPAQARGTKSEVVASPPSRGPIGGRKCYATAAFSGVPNANCGEQNQKWLPHPCLLGGP